MKKIYPAIIIISALLYSPQAAFSQSGLAYQRITSGLNEPDFEKGRTDFAFEDINNDGHLDLLSVGDHGSPNFNSAQHGIMVWLGDGAGNFENHMNGQFGYGGIAVADVNNDGFKDVGYGVHHNYSPTNFGDQLIEVVLGDGTGTNWEVYDTGLAANGEEWGMFGTAFADFNHDGLPDLAGISFGCCAGLHVYLNQGDGSWQQSFGFLDGGSDHLVRTCDINNDGHMDIIASHQFGAAWFGDGAGDFSKNDTGLPLTGTNMLRGMDIARMNDQPVTGISCTNLSGGVEVYAWNNSTSEWDDWSGNLPASGPYQLTQLHDMNRDGLADVMAFGNKQFQLWLGDGAGNWTADVSFTTPGDPGNGNALRAGGDFDLNGHPDFLVLAQELTGGWIQFEKNILYMYFEESAADSLLIEPVFPRGGENFYPGTTQFIEWACEVPAGETSTVNIEISAFGPDGPWWTLAENLPNSGKYQWTVPDYGSDQVYLKMTLETSSGNAAVGITNEAFNIFGNPTGLSEKHQIQRTLVFPNPTSARLFLRNPEMADRVRLFSLTGRIMIDIRQPDRVIDVEFLPPGIYFYQIDTHKGDVLKGKWLNRAD